MTKEDLISKVSAGHGLTKKATRDILDSFISGIKGAVKEDGKFMLLGFGTFTAKDRAARNGFNPLTGETIKIDATKAVTFKPGKEFKEFINS